MEKVKKNEELFTSSKTYKFTHTIAYLNDYDELNNWQKIKKLAVDEELEVLFGIPLKVIYRCGVSKDCPYKLYAVQDFESGSYQLLENTELKHYHGDGSDLKSYIDHFGKKWVFVRVLSDGKAVKEYAENNQLYMTSDKKLKDTTKEKIYLSCSRGFNTKRRCPHKMMAILGHEMTFNLFSREQHNHKETKVLAESSDDSSDSDVEYLATITNPKKSVDSDKKCSAGLKRKKPTGSCNSSRVNHELEGKRAKISKSIGAVNTSLVTSRNTQANSSEFEFLYTLLGEEELDGYCTSNALYKVASRADQRDFRCEKYKEKAIKCPYRMVVKEYNIGVFKIYASGEHDHSRLNKTF